MEELIPEWKQDNSKNFCLVIETGYIFIHNAFAKAVLIHGQMLVNGYNYGVLLAPPML